MPGGIVAISPFSLKRGAVVISALVLALAAKPFSSPRAAEQLDPPTVSPATACEGLLFHDFTTIPEAPTRITGAETVKAQGVKPFCKITGYVAPQVGFELHLPTEGWTQRLVFTGCGGLCGWIRMGVEQSYGCSPVETGNVALVASNLGHSGWNPGDGVWANGDPAARVDFGYRGTHVVTLASKAIIQAYYGQLPKYSYFVGCSDGGREALMEAERFPKDFDGVTAGDPAYNVTELNVFHHIWNVRANISPDGKAMLISSRIPILHNAVLAACDKIGGLGFGVIDDPRQCKFDIQSIVCKNATDTSNCLTQAEADAASKIYAGPRDAAGRRLTVAGMAYGSEGMWPGVITADDPNMPPFNKLIATGFVKNIAWWTAPPSGFGLSDVHLDGETEKSLEPIMSVIDATNPDLRPFAQAGGKLILYHGWADQHFPAANTLAYRSAVIETVGADLSDKFLRTFLIPGMGHCGDGPGPNKTDVVTAIMNWVENGQAPEKLIVNRIDNGAVVGSRPIYPYPTISLWDGKGNPKMLESYAPANPEAGKDNFDWLGKSLYSRESQHWCKQDGLTLVCAPTR
jgi:Tannase and feruloyl esterase